MFPVSWTGKVIGKRCVTAADGARGAESRLVGGGESGEGDVRKHGTKPASPQFSTRSVRGDGNYESHYYPLVATVIRMNLSRRSYLGLGAAVLSGCVARGGEPAGTPEATATSEPPVPTPRFSYDDPSVGAPGDPLAVAFNSRERFRDVGWLVDDFEDERRWETFAGRLAVEEDVVYCGSQSLRLEATPADERVWIYRTFDGGIDLSGADLSLAVNLETPDTEGITVRLAAPDYDNTLLLGRHIWRAGWQRLDLGPRRVTGSPDLTNVTEISIQLYTGGGTTARFYVDSLRAKPRADAGKVMITFDDNTRSQYDTAYPILESHGFPGVVGVIPWTVGSSHRIPRDGMDEMVDAGWDMVSHPQRSDSFRDLSPVDQRASIRESKAWLVENGFERGADFIIWPYGRYDESALDAASDYHYLGFVTVGGPTGAISDPQIVGRTDGDDVKTAKQALDFAAQYNQLAVLMYHDVTGEGRSVSPAAFAETIDYVDELGLDVVTASSYWESIRDTV